MCKYCTTDYMKREKFNFDLDKVTRFGDTPVTPIELSLAVEYDTSTFIVGWNHKGYPQPLCISVGFPFDYCPFCGRKLVEEKNV